MTVQRDTSLGSLVIENDVVHIPMSVKEALASRQLSDEQWSELKELHSQYGKGRIRFEESAWFKSRVEVEGEIPGVISKTPELSLPRDAEFLSSVLAGYEEDVRALFAPVRHNPEGQGVVELFYQYDLVSNVDLQDIYSEIRDGLKSQPWCTEVVANAALPTIIKYIKVHYGKGSGAAVTNNGQLGVTLTEKARTLIVDCIRNKASDIHVEYNDNGSCSFNFRIDKQMVEYNKLDSEDAKQLLANLFNLGESDGESTMGFVHDRPQKCAIRFSAELSEGVIVNYTLRWQSLSTDTGTKIVLRPLNNDPGNIDQFTWEGMGYADTHREMIKESLVRKNGFVLLNGATSSGKSTTTAKMLSDMNKLHPHWSLDTIEDPIEYRIEGVSQHPVDRKLMSGEGMSDIEHAAAIINKMFESLLRMDPDVIGVGEIRNRSMAELIAKTVTTGHKAIGTLHAKNILSTYSRMHDLGLDIKTQTRPDFYSLLIYQTLIPKPCKDCSLPLDKAASALLIPITEVNALERLLGRNNLSSVIVHNPAGCKSCRNGLNGMTVCAEMMIPDRETNEALVAWDMYKAQDAWVNSMERYSEDCDFLGTTVEDHMLYKILMGEISPTSVADDFSTLASIAKTRKGEVRLSRHHQTQAYSISSAPEKRSVANV